MAVLRSTKGLNPGQLFPLDRDTMVLGRHPECDIVLGVGAVSRQHARISRVEGEYFVEDLGSRNGTFVNDQVTEGRHRLSKDDRLRICDLEFVFEQSPTQGSSLADGSTGEMVRATLVDDAESTAVGSSVLSKVDISAGRSGLQLTVNPEVKLKALLEIGQNLGQALGLAEVLPKVLDSLFRVFLQADRGFIVLRDLGTGHLIPKALKHRRKNATEQVRISRTIVKRVMDTRAAVLSADAATDSRFDMAESIVDFQIHSMMCAPLVGSQGQVLGVIQIDTMDQRKQFTGDDLEVLASVACQAAIAVENAQLHEVAVSQAALRRELAVAHRVQQGFLPASPPSMSNYDFFDFYEPARELGGDYFDYIPISGERVAVVLADVSGKGVSAALLMAKLSSEARYCLAREVEPVDAVARLNEIFCESRWEDRFITMVLAVLDPNRHEVGMVIAGHMPPLIRHPSGAVEPAGQSAAGLPLGVAEGVRYELATVGLGPGDSLTMYTDGICEAMNRSQELYGDKRLEVQLAAPASNLREMGEHVLADVRDFVGDTAQSDDMCIASLERLA